MNAKLHDTRYNIRSSADVLTRYSESDAALILGVIKFRDAAIRSMIVFFDGRHIEVPLGDTDIVIIDGIDWFLVAKPVYCRLDHQRSEKHRTRQYGLLARLQFRPCDRTVRLTCIHKVRSYGG